MFLRVVRAPSGKTGVKHEYVRVVEAYRDHEGKTQHQTIINLGRKDLLAAHLDLDKLNRLLHGEPAADPKLVTDDDVGAIGAWDWGPMLVARHLWCALGLEMTIDSLSSRDRSDAVPLSDPRPQRLVADRRPICGRATGIVGEGAFGGGAEPVDVDDVKRWRAARK